MSENKNGTVIVLMLAIVASIALSVCLSYATSCTCNDICDIDNAATVAKAAQWEYQMQIQLLNDDEIRTGSPTWYFPWRYQNDIQPLVQKRINDFAAICQPPLNRAAGVTNGGSCQITVEPTSVCMTEFVMAHENTHKSKCESFSHTLTYQMNDTLAEALAEEIRAYQTTIDLKKSLKQGPLKDCCCKNSCTPTGPGTIVGAINMLKQIARNLLR